MLFKQHGDPEWTWTCSNELRSSEFLNAVWDLSPAELLEDILSHGGLPYFVVGDSHSNAYVPEPNNASTGWLAPMHLVCYGGSALGLDNERSRSNYGTRVLKWAEQAASARKQARVPIFLKFGQVDTEFVWTFQRIRDGNSSFAFEHFMRFSQSSISSYFSFLEKLVARLGTEGIYVCSIFPPVLSDETWARGYVNAHIGALEGDRDLSALEDGVRRLEIPSMAIRTSLHRQYNDLLRSKARSAGLHFLDDFSPFLGTDGIAQKQYYAYSSGNDHHIDPALARKVIAERILPYVQRQNRRLRRDRLRQRFGQFMRRTKTPSPEQAHTSLAD